MMNLSNKKTYLALLLGLLMCCVGGRSFATVASVQLVPASPTLLSNGRAYYLAGLSYVFDIHVIDIDAAAWGDVSEVRLTIPNSTLIDVRVTPSGVGPQVPVIVSGAVAVPSATIPAGGTPGNFHVLFEIQFGWNTPESAWAAARSVGAQATSTVPGANSLSSSVSLSYGVCSSVLMLNPSLSGEAADLRLSRYHEAFTAGADAIVYNVPGASVSDSVSAVDPAEMTAVNLLLDANVIGSDIAFPAISIATADAQLNTLGYTWSVTPIAVRFRAQMATGAVNETVQNSLSLICDEYEITDFGFSGGGGVSTHPNYFRSLLVAGTSAWVNVRMRAAGTAVTGNIAVTVRDLTDGTVTSVPVAAGQASGTALATMAGLSIGAGATALRSYEIRAITGGPYGSASGYGQNAADSTRIAQPVNRNIRWENGDPPGSNAGLFVVAGGSSSTPNSISLLWDPTGMTVDDNDFYSYQLYFRVSGSSDPYTVIDRTTAGYNTADPTNGNLELRATAGMTITGLDYLTFYEMRLSAVDVFGNEVSDANRLDYSALTLPSALSCDVTDGITVYPDGGFTAETPALRPLRPSAIRIELYVVSSGSVPDSISVIAAPYAAPDMVTAGGVLVGVENTDYYRYQAFRIAPNRWAAYIPSTSPLVTMGGQVRFIVETVKGGSISYSDWDSEGDIPPGNPNDYEWTFSINTPVVLTPWPVRILNNVITKKNPVAYPAYYLTEDGYVTIVVYDIKGRPIITLLENAFRRGGSNIKENGWRGRNKKGRKCGPGLYYVRITAKRTTGKTLLREVEKVVISE